MTQVQNDVVSAKDLSMVKLLEKTFESSSERFDQSEAEAKRRMQDWQMERSMREITKFQYESFMYQGVEVLRFT